MTQIAATDSALLRLLESCKFPGVTILSAPHEWDGGFVQRLIGDLPAVLVAFVGAEKPDDRYTELNLDGRWACYIATGWNGSDQAARRLGSGAGYDLMHRVGATLHNAMLLDENGERLTRVTVDGMGVETDSALDIANLWIGSVSVEVELPMELDPGSPCFGPLDAWLRIGATFDIEGGKPLPDISDAGEAGDFPAQIDLPQ